MSLIESSGVCVSLSSSSPSLHRLPVSGGHVEAGDHHQVGFAEVDSRLQFVRHGLQSLQILQRVHFVGRLYLKLAGPFVRLQHQVLLGLFQLFLQTLVLCSDFSDSLLTVLQHPQLGADVHHLLAPSFVPLLQSLDVIYLVHLDLEGFCRGRRAPEV